MDKEKIKVIVDNLLTLFTDLDLTPKFESEVDCIVKLSKKIGEASALGQELVWNIKELLDEDE